MNRFLWAGLILAWLAAGTVGAAAEIILIAILAGLVVALLGWLFRERTDGWPEPTEEDDPPPEITREGPERPRPAGKVVPFRRRT